MESNETKTKNGLMRKTKSELVDIILRKDDVEIRLKETLKTKDEDIDILNSRIVGYEADINGLTRMREDNLDAIKELTQTLNRKKVIVRRWQIAFSIILVIAGIIIGILA